MPKFTCTQGEDVGTKAPITVSAEPVGSEVLFTFSGTIVPVGNIGGHLVFGVVLHKVNARSLGKFLATMDA